MKIMPNNPNNGSSTGTSTLSHLLSASSSSNLLHLPNHHPMDIYAGMSKEDLDALSSDAESDTQPCESSRDDHDDDDSDDDDSDDDSDDDDDDASIAASIVSKTHVSEFQGFEGGFDENDPMAKQMESILSLKLALGVDNDREFLVAHERSKREKAQKEQAERLAKEQEAERVANMTLEERIELESQQASSMFASMAQKYHSKQEQLKQQYTWEQPEWAKKPKLKATKAGEKVKKGVDLQGPITQAPHLHKNYADEDVEDDVQDEVQDMTMSEPPPLVPIKKESLKHASPTSPSKKKIGWEKPEWAKKPKLKTTKAGEAVKKGVDLQAPITKAPQLAKSKSKRNILGGDLQAPITQAPRLAKSKSRRNIVIASDDDNNDNDDNDGNEDASSSPTAPVKKLKKKPVLPNSGGAATATGKKSIEWEKPEWALKTKLRTTAAGQAVKKGVDLQAPITLAPQLSKSKSKRNLLGGATSSACADLQAATTLAPQLSKNKSKRNLQGDASCADLQAPTALAPQLAKSKSKRNLLGGSACADLQAPTALAPQLAKSKSKRNLLDGAASASALASTVTMSEVQASISPAPQLAKSKSRRNLLAGAASAPISASASAVAPSEVVDSPKKITKKPLNIVPKEETKAEVLDFLMKNKKSPATSAAASPKPASKPIVAV